MTERVVDPTTLLEYDPEGRRFGSERTSELFDAGTDDSVREPKASSVHASDHRPVLTFHERDGTVLVDGDYVIRGFAGRLLFTMFVEHERSGITRFSNS